MECGFSSIYKEPYKPLGNNTKKYKLHFIILNN